MSIIKTETGKIFGGYTNIPWNIKQETTYHFGDYNSIEGNGDSFLFSLREDGKFIIL